uniref:Uncharacterized protein n=1 Tax=Arundo donax TaxID=35708 RepID=A0A0A9FYU6_ARUDO
MKAHNLSNKDMHLYHLKRRLLVALIHHEKCILQIRDKEKEC